MLRCSLLLLVLCTGCPTTDQFTPRDVIGLEPAASVTAGGFHTCAVLENGNRACWGGNGEGQIGVALEGSSVSVPVFVPLDADATSMSAGGLHTCAVLEDGGVACWGDNRGDQLGFSGCEPGAFTCPAEPTRVPGISDAIAVAAGGPRDYEAGAPQRGFSCAALADGTAWCWGRNLGADPSPRQVFDAGGFPLRDIVHVTAGSEEACAIDTAGSLWCWDDIEAARREAELPPVVDASAGGGHVCAATIDGEVICWGANLNGQSGAPAFSSACDPCLVGPTVVPNVSGAVGVTAGQRHSCAVDGGGGAICWGTNQNGQLGVEIGGLALEPVRVTTKNRVRSIEAGDAHTCAALEGGGLQCWGSDSQGQLGIGR